MRTPGTTVSAIGHLGLIGWLIVGWGFNAEPLEFTETSVSIISGEEFDQLTQATTPEPGTAEPTAPVQPVVDVTPPEPPAVEEPTQVALPPDPVEPPVDDTPPPPAPTPPPVADVTDVAPDAPVTPVTPPPAPDLPVVSDNPTQQQADVVSSELVEPTPPDTPIDDVPRDQVVADDTEAAEEVIEEEEPAAPPPTTTEIVIEDETPSGAVETSLRPVTRPSRLQPPAPETEENTEVADVEEVTPAEPDTNEDEVAAALAAALAAETPSDAPAVAAGPPMNETDRAGFRVSVQSCWNVGGLSSAAQRVTVTVSFSLTRDRKVVGDNVELIGASGGDDGAVEVAFRAARIAVLRCQNQGGGFDLPTEKYDSWQDVELTFDPDSMRQR